jgi:membrane peptidoglycan carboxypeptidase
MADVYATLADGGWRNSPIAITKVVFPDGHADTDWGQPHRVRVLSEAVTAEETSILHQNVLGGTAVRSVISCPSAAKTGTTSELVDAWLDGYTPDYSTVVWMGYPKRDIPMTDVHGEPQQGGALPAVIWKTYMSAVTEGKPCVELPQSKEAISYQPFYGKFATTGLAQAGQQSERSSEQPPAKHFRRSRHTETPSGHSKGHAETPSPSPPAGPPSGPAAHPPEEAPTVRKTGGAAPG